MDYDFQVEDVTREVSLSRQLMHPNIVAVWDSYTRPDITGAEEKEPVAYIVMERCLIDLRHQMETLHMQVSFRYYLYY